MRNSYTYGRTVNIELEVYNVCKYYADLADLENPLRVRYQGLVSWDIVSGYEASQIEAETDEDSYDDLHEYLVLHFENGSEATFRNSYVDMFRV